MAFNALVTPPGIDAGILDRLPLSATQRHSREAALSLASAPMHPTPINRYWRIDFAKLDLHLTADRQHLAPIYTLPAEFSQHGMIFCSLAEAMLRHPELISRHLGTVIPPEESRFTAITTALELGGYFLYIPAHIKLSAPLSIAIDIPNGSLWTPRHLIILEEGASASIQETITTSGIPASEKTLVCGTVEAVLAPSARLRVLTQQLLDPAAQSFMTRRAMLANKAYVEWTLCEFGGALVQSRLDTLLQGRLAESIVAALFFPHEQQHIDVTTEVVHAVSDTRSHTIVKAAAKDHGQGRYGGNIQIKPGAHGSVAKLRDDSLLLSPHAHVDSIPALEIAANDVQAFHGATVGAIDDHIRFYLMSRGISAAESDRMIALAFFEPVLATIEDVARREQIGAYLAERVGSMYAH